MIKYIFFLELLYLFAFLKVVNILNSTSERSTSTYVETEQISIVMASTEQTHRGQ